MTLIFANAAFEAATLGGDSDTRRLFSLAGAKTEVLNLNDDSIIAMNRL